MLDRSSLTALLFISLMAPITGCGTSMVDSLAVTPASQSVAVGQTAQFTATGTYGHGSHPSTTQNVTDESTWTSSAPGVATVDASGVATALSPGTTTITASIVGYTGVLSSSAVLTVSGTSGAGADVVSVKVIPGTQSVATPNQNTQFLAIGTTSTGTTVNLGGAVAWYSSDSGVASINQSTGLAQGANQGTTTITAIATNSDNTVAAGEATLTVISGASEQIASLTITPTSESISAEGQTSQLLAIGTVGSTNLQENLTSSPNITWISSIPSVASVSPTGLVTGASVGTTSVSAYFTNSDSTIVQATAPAVITTTSTPTPEPLLSLTIIPSTITVGQLEDTGNFLAIGTFSTTPNVRDLTNSVAWISSAPQVFPVSTNNTSSPNPGAPGGIVTADGNGSAVIIAEATDTTTGSIQTATATFNCPLTLPNPSGNPPTPGTCFVGSQEPGLLVTLTVYNEGLNTTDWLVTAPSATNTPDVLHCGPGWAGDLNSGGSVCTATYPLGTTVTLTAPAQAGVSFGGWSYNCTPILTVNANGPNSCSVTLGNDNNSNVTVGAIFN